MAKVASKAAPIEDRKSDHIKINLNRMSAALTTGLRTIIIHDASLS
jgi:hypothetical protein